MASNLPQNFTPSTSTSAVITIEYLPHQRHSANPNSPWFHFLKASKGDTAKCKECCKIIKTPASGTTGLREHLKRIHQEILECGDTNLSKVVKTKTVLDMGIMIQKKSLGEALAKMAAVDGISFNVLATSEEIRKGLTAQKYEGIPTSANGIRNMIIKFSQSVMEKDKIAIKALKETGVKFSIAFDEWTSLANRRYVNIILFDIKSHWNLGIQRIMGSTSAEKLLDTVSKQIGTYQLEMNDDIVSTITDGTTMMTKIGRILGTIHQQLCLAHGIQLAVIDIMYKKIPVVESSSAESEDDDTSDSNQLGRHNR